MMYAPFTPAKKFKGLALVNHGNHGEVYSAWDKSRKIKVALKRLRPYLQHDKNAKEKFLHEIEIIKHIAHPACLTYLEHGDYYFVTQWIEGKSLRKNLRKQGPFPLEKALTLTQGLLEALKYLQTVSIKGSPDKQGMIQGDFHPGNILLEKEKPILVDFAYGSFMEPRKKDFPEQGGTPLYQSPYQLQQHRVPRFSDVYALGLVLLEMLTGKTVFFAEDYEATRKIILGFSPEKFMEEHRIAPSCRDFIAYLFKNTDVDFDFQFEKAEKLLKDTFVNS